MGLDVNPGIFPGIRNRHTLAVRCDREAFGEVRFRRATPAGGDHSGRQTNGVDYQRAVLIMTDRVPVVGWCPSCQVRMFSAIQENMPGPGIFANPEPLAFSLHEEQCGGIRLNSRGSATAACGDDVRLSDRVRSLVGVYIVGITASGPDGSSFGRQNSCRK